MKHKYNKQKSFGYDANGKRIIKWFHADSKSDLERQIQKYRMQLELTPNASNIRFKDYAEQWRTTYKGNRSKATQDMYKYALTHTEIIDNLPLTRITKTKCQECIQTVWDKPTTAKNLANTLRQVFNTAVQDGMLMRNPSLNLDLPKKPKPKFHLITEREQKAIDEAELNPQDRMFVTILQTFGLRPSEALALTVSDFDFSSMTLHITKSVELGNDNQSVIKGTKTGASRDIPIPFSLKPIIMNYFKEIRGFYLFVDKDTTLVSKSGYRAISRRILSEINKKMGGDDTFNMIPNFSMYCFRHKRATELFYLTQKGVISILQASKLMGHSVNVFLNTYSHIDESKESLQRIYEAVTNL